MKTNRISKYFENQIVPLKGVLAFLYSSATFFVQLVEHNVAYMWYLFIGNVRFETNVFELAHSLYFSSIDSVVKIKSLHCWGGCDDHQLWNCLNLSTTQMTRISKDITCTSTIADLKAQIIVSAFCAIDVRWKKYFTFCGVVKSIRNGFDVLVRMCAHHLSLCAL